ncbi:hypothetical protein SDC9_70449 [bioreactor metagenome]|uniref:Uncharacterized protein n=1 Tax=bioreactor metagenome TaxID=1076179 RepID=A0A644Y5Y5_9ZZZZ|nr:DUF6103 family protein [Sedimentibacter sp.]
MKKDTISVSLEAEKLRAIKKYMEKKEIDLQAELAEQLQKLYEKHVPVNVREYIDEKNEEENRAKTPRKPAKNTGAANSTSTPQE